MEIRIVEVPTSKVLGLIGPPEMSDDPGAMDGLPHSNRRSGRKGSPPPLHLNRLLDPFDRRDDVAEPEESCPEERCQGQFEKGRGVRQERDDLRRRLAQPAQVLPLLHLKACFSFGARRTRRRARLYVLYGLPHRADRPARGLTAETETWMTRRTAFVVPFLFVHTTSVAPYRSFMS